MKAASPVFIPEGPAVSKTDLNSVETSLGVQLPPSYIAFVTTLGPGLWCGEAVKPPSALYAFDSDCEEMEGFIALVENVQGIGDHLAFDPADPPVSGERPLYYCGHDPFGCARTSDSFAAWTSESFQAFLADESPYAAAEAVIAQTPSRALRPGAKRWWQFWRK